MLASGPEALSRRSGPRGAHEVRYLGCYIRNRCNPPGAGWSRRRVEPGRARLDGMAADQRRDYARCGWTPWSPLCDRPSISLGIIITAASPTIT